LADKESKKTGKVCTALATPNIALVKYWGKRDEKLILPMNSSISITMGEEFTTKTSIMFTDRIDEDIFYINGERQDLSNKDVKERFDIINIMRNMAGTEDRVIVVSENSFPTAAGLASSASGIAAMVFAANSALGLNLDAKSMSVIARQGSGSSCRSLAGGFVKWEKGLNDDGTDSHIRQIATPEHWPELVDIVAIVSSSRKKVSSRAGMKQTMETSALYNVRPEYAENSCVELERATASKDFEKLGMITMRESNNLHAVMLDTYPPIFYLNDISKEIIYAIDELNRNSGRIIAAYTFDAGPNAQIITLDKHKAEVEKVLSGISGIEKLYATKPGSGPRLLSEAESMIDPDKLDIMR
jgi:diphosphomevalonate decarboxylase